MASDIEITVHEGTKELYSKTITGGTIGEKQLEELLRSLAASYGRLNGDELIGSYLKQNARNRHDLLEIRKSNRPGGFSITCGESVHAMAMFRPRA